jgi:dienelactone hydrolase
MSGAARPAHGSANHAAPSLAPRLRPYSRILLALPFLPLLFLAIAPAAYNELRATSILLQIAGAPTPAIPDFDANPVAEEEITFPSLTPTRARIYHPIGIAHPSPLVVIHGVHHLGMDEPRLQRFARALASHGYLVFTPQVDELADYSITKNSAVVIGDAVHELVRRSGAPKVGLLGLSFAGGMALIAASDPAVAPQLSAVIAIGAHDDLRRVLDFYQTDQTRAPDGSLIQMPAHEYGSLVVVYSHASAFFAPADVAHARGALRALLWEDLPQAHAEAAQLSSQGQERMAQLFAHDTKSLAPDIQRGLAAVQAELDAASPHFYLSRVHVPVMLLHGAADNVVPPTETLWLERDLPPGVLQAALISPAIGHVELGGASWRDRWRLLQWMKQMLGLLDTSSAERG